MRLQGREPVRLTGLEAIRAYALFMRDPIATISEALETYGPFVLMATPFHSRRKLTGLAVGAEFNREIFSDPDMWRTAHVMILDRKNTAARRIGIGLISLNGRRHAYYRRLLTAPFRLGRIEALGDEMGALMQGIVAGWPVDEAVDLWLLVRELMQTLAIAVLFNGDLQRGWPIAELLNTRARFSWTVGAALLPFNLPFTPYGRMRRQSERIEQGILDWAECKRGQIDERDVLSILVNSPTETGEPPDAEAIVGQAPTLLLAAYDTCQSALIWTLLLLAQHPTVARPLVEEIRGALDGGPPSLAKVGALPLLDRVVKESMRILPPVPMQTRSAHDDITLAGYPVPARSRIILSNLHTNRAPQLYPEPDQFKPERWERLNPTPFEYSVFSAGPRSCPGSWFGTALLKVGLATILDRYRISLRPDAVIDYRVRVTMAPKTPVPARLHPQDFAFERTPLRGGYARLVPLAA